MGICLVRVLLCLTESPHLNITTNSYINNSHSLFSQTFQRTSSPYFIFRWKKHVLLPTWVRNASVGRNLVEQDTERPDVGLVGELPVADGLRSAPLVGDLLVFWDVKRLLDEKKCVLKKSCRIYSTCSKRALTFPPSATLITLASPKSATLQV